MFWLNFEFFFLKHHLLVTKNFILSAENMKKAEEYNGGKNHHSVLRHSHPVHLGGLAVFFPLHVSIMEMIYQTDITLST